MVHRHTVHTKIADQCIHKSLVLLMHKLAKCWSVPAQTNMQMTPCWCLCVPQTQSLPFIKSAGSAAWTYLYIVIRNVNVDILTFCRQSVHDLLPTVYSCPSADSMFMSCIAVMSLEACRYADLQELCALLQPLPQSCCVQTSEDLAPAYMHVKASCLQARLCFTSG